ncbi:hypothetical protein AXG93_4130s1010 [Marchantia polymorpha subsp. ruderalis]|uniref:Uncharacterized protein n=1 Tax=Marchantia polymorpha subsp. ruderalis TaxID=1480154 RepID=A0A176WEI9_MARPO|nr:hypothetical protein AXG93_4130s1010 [Marchantia polymorpha subsp. ruderalis]
METETTIGRLEQKIVAGFTTRVERCLRGYVDYEIQTTLWCYRCYIFSTGSGRSTPKAPPAEQASDSLCEDLKRAKCDSVDLLKRLEACQTAYDAESLKVSELQAAAEEAKREYQAELAIKTKKLSEYKAARIADLELIEKLQAQCGELRTQRSQAKEKLCEVEAKLTEAEGKIRQLSEETSEALTAHVEQCLRGYALWQIESHNGLRLREIEQRAVELIKKSGRRHLPLSKKLESYLIRSRDAVAKLELSVLFSA